MSEADRSPGTAVDVDRYRIDRHSFVEMIDPAAVARAVDRVAAAIERDYGTKQEGAEAEPILLLCVLKGGAMFLADLLRRLSMPVTVDFLGVTSYGDAMSSNGTPTITAQPSTPIGQRNVIVVEDLVDSGATLAFLRRYVLDEGAVSVRVATLLDKGLAGDEEAEYCGLKIDDRFVVGYGMDYRERGRELPGIWVLADETLEESRENRTI